MNTVILEAARLTSAGQLREATEIIQRTLHGVHESQVAANSASGVPETPIEGDFHVIDAEAVATRASAREPECRPPPRPRGASHERTNSPRVGIAALHEQWRGFRGPMPLSDAVLQAPDPLPDGARFVTGSYTNPAGTCSYKLYVPSGYHEQPLPLVVMFHGCTQNPDDFAAGTRMNKLAEDQLCFVLYPAQTRCR